MIANFDTCRAQDVSAMVFTLATLNHNSSLPDSEIKKMFEVSLIFIFIDTYFTILSYILCFESISAGSAQFRQT